MAEASGSLIGEMRRQIHDSLAYEAGSGRIDC